MAMSDNYRGAVCLLGTVALIFLVYVYFATGGNVPRQVANVPEVGPLFEAVNHFSLVPATFVDKPHPYQGGHKAYLQPVWDSAQNVKTQHRYPEVSGGNISLIMHKGWDPMILPAPCDGKWAEMPPPDQVIYGGSPT